MAKSLFKIVPQVDIVSNLSDLITETNSSHGFEMTSQPILHTHDINSTELINGSILPQEAVERLESLTNELINVGDKTDFGLITGVILLVLIFVWVIVWCYKRRDRIWLTYRVLFSSVDNIRELLTFQREQMDVNINEPPRPNGNIDPGVTGEIRHEAEVQVVLSESQIPPPEPMRQIPSPQPMRQISNARIPSYRILNNSKEVRRT